MAPSPHPSTSQLERKLGLADAFHIGIASMIGAGVFAVFAPAAQAAGGALLVGLVLAAIVAWCNATSSAQLAAQYPTAGGTYIFGRERLGEWPGYLAGWCFVVGKTASCAAMAMVIAAYVVPTQWQKVVAIVVVWLLAAVNCFGVTRTARLARILVVLALIALATALGVGWFGTDGASYPIFTAPDGVSGWYGVLQSGGMLFFAFAGYARIATMGEEVKEPERTIPRAIVSALLVTLAVYAVVAITLLAVLGPDQLAASEAPVAELVAGNTVASVVLRVGAVAAAGGALLGLMTGIGRTSLAMARHSDLPGWFQVTHPRYKVPHRVELVLAVLLTVVLVLVDLRGAIGFSSFGVLLYYFIANISAWTQDAQHRRYPKFLQILGAIVCLVLVITLPWPSIIGGLVVVVIGIAARALSIRRRHSAKA